MATNSKRHPVDRPARAKVSLRPVQEKRDDDIMNTNDSSIVSKRSVAVLYFPDEPDFYQPFVGKLVRRSPLINRGYWLRMHAVEQVVRRFLEENSNKSKVVVNLGCGYDPLPFQFWHRHGSICRNATFVDVDYPQLIDKKRDRMLTSRLLRDALLKTNLRPAEAPVHLQSERYMAIGCDLRDLDILERILTSHFDASSTSILFVAEVSITYMPVRDSDALLRWASKFEDARFCLLEQYLPQGSKHPFARTMLAHFNKLQTTIHAVAKYPSLIQQQTRFLNAGWSTLDISRNLWDLWSDDSFTPQERRLGLDAMEPFDEWEEFALFAGHYFLILASNGETGRQDQLATAVSSDPHGSGISEDPSHSTFSIKIVSHAHPADDNISQRRFGAAYSLGCDHFAFHGGQGPQRRLSSLDVFGRGGPKPNASSSHMPPARMCHTITALNDREALLVGGRKSPSMPLCDCWLFADGAWKEVHELHPGRFRHSSARVKLRFEAGEEVETVLVYGGKTMDGRVLDESTIWVPTQGWKIVPVVGARPSPRFGAAISTMGSTGTRGLIVSGMAPSGTVLDDIWEYSISTVPQLQVHFTERTNEVAPTLPRTRTRSLYARLGASLLPFGDSLLLIGGIASKEILALSEEFLVISPQAAIEINEPLVNNADDAWPLLVGCGAAATSESEILVAGGGAVCFSMGSFWNQGYLTIFGGGAENIQPWSVSNVRCADGPTEAALKQPSKAKPKATGRTTSGNMSIIPRVRLHSPDDFSGLLKASKPAIIEGLNLGPCTSRWTFEYLKDQIGADRSVVIHDSTSPYMTFASRNFSYVKTPFGAFIDNISQGAKTYLRAISSTHPNKLPTTLEDDFPTIASDFYIPPELGFVKDTYHSSPLRISGPVSLWLHYDVLANVLCQIRGSKTLTLYPPSDVKYLDFPPGGSSSNISVSSLPYNIRLAHTHPHIAAVKPGDVLFIPPMWSHTASPEEGYSVAVNIFFRNLDAGYAAGKDVYGNRDLAAYENGRRDIEKILRGFKDVPEDLKKFYLDRLATELQDRADKIGESVN